MSTLSLCVYCGSRTGERPEFAAAAREVGDWIARKGWRLVYGGGRAGLMGVVADAALAGGAEVIGVIPTSLMQRELGHTGVTELHVVETMHQRKQKMAELSDAFVALPGGIGTFEELFEVWTWRQLGYHDKPIGLLNLDGYYDLLLSFIGHSAQCGFMDSRQQVLLRVHKEVSPLLDALANMAPRATAADDYRLI